MIKDLIYEANRQQNQLLKAISKQKFKGKFRPKQSDESKFLTEEQKILTYCRFTTSLTVKRFQELIDKGLLQLKDEKGQPIEAQETKKLVDRLEQIDCLDQSENLSAIGQAVAQEQFDISLFEDYFLED